MKRRLTTDQDTDLPIEYWMSASEESLRNFEGLQLNHASNLEKEIMVMTAARDRARVLAETARLLIDNRAEMMRQAGNHLERVEGESQRLLRGPLKLVPTSLAPLIDAGGNNAGR